MTPSVDEFWSAFLDGVPDESAPDGYDNVFSFGDSPELADELGALVVAGEKTATAEARWTFEAEGERAPAPGDYSVVLDGSGDPLCVVETVEVRVVPFDEVDEAFARDEGEGYESVEEWREDHWQYFSRTLSAHDRSPTERMPVVCERFRVVYDGH
ncbi:ASCH domain-containing protein [Halomarina salina]|uniref:ASCH domain-containing protein n=1 Tax=Halomarina salina TaxID=1872699 RepID=A0ABD5RL27_9EURY|nr:ASCH domain-containing protein [Halomarina salina]